jgi:putative cell wall-binding protein
MKKITKLYSSITAVALLTSVVLTPSAIAETQDLTDYQKDVKRMQTISYLKDRNLQTSTEGNTSYSALAVVNQAIYQNKVNIYSDHEYNFFSAGGKFTITHNNHEDIDFFIFNNDTEEIVYEISTDTYDLPRGNYSLIVTSYNESMIDYKFQLNGNFEGTPDVTLPTLQVTAPSAPYLRLPKGTATYDVKGSTNAQDLYIGVNNYEDYIENPGTFSHKVTLEKGMNSLYLYAQESTNNAIVSYFNVTVPGVSRIAGKDRYEVSAGVSRQLNNWDYNTGTVVIARGDMYPDALSGGPLSAFEGAPVLLTATKELPSAIQKQIIDLGAERAIILGGTGSVSANVETQLKNLGVTEIERIGGKDRFVVSASTAERVADYWESDTAIIASGEVFPDALSASTIAGPSGMPILLVKSDTITDPVQTFIKNHPEITNFIIVGGPATVKTTVSDKIRQLRGGAYIERIGGKDRYEVAINVAKFGMENLGIDLSTLTVVRGDIFPDALSGAPLANVHAGPILLTTSAKLEAKVNTFLQNNQSQIDNIFIVGGTGSVSTTAEQQLNGHIK